MSTLHTSTGGRNTRSRGIDLSDDLNVKATVLEQPHIYHSDWQAGRSKVNVSSYSALGPDTISAVLLKSVYDVYSNSKYTAEPGEDLYRSTGEYDLVLSTEPVASKLTGPVLHQRKNIPSERSIATQIGQANTILGRLKREGDDSEGVIRREITLTGVRQFRFVWTADDGWTEQSDTPKSVEDAETNAANWLLKLRDGDMQ